MTIVEEVDATTLTSTINITTSQGTEEDIIRSYDESTGVFTTESTFTDRTGTITTTKTESRVEDDGTIRTVVS